MSETQQNNEGETGAPRLIKRYANRKLYDTKESRYVTLHQVAEFVRAQEDVRIVDNRTKEDLTNVTLAQIIYEEEKAGDSDARRGSLLTFIQEGRERLITSLPKFPFLRDENELGAEGGDVSAIDAALRLRAEADDRVRGIVTAAVEEVQLLQREAEVLRGRIGSLEARLSALLKAD